MRFNAAVISSINLDISHALPSWAKDGAVFHVRIRVAREWGGALSDASLAPRLLESVVFYQAKAVWNCRLILLMPDHLHALIAFNP